MFAFFEEGGQIIGLQADGVGNFADGQLVMEVSENIVLTMGDVPVFPDRLIFFFLCEQIADHFSQLDFGSSRDVLDPFDVPGCLHFLDCDVADIEGCLGMQAAVDGCAGGDRRGHNANVDFLPERIL